MSAYYQNPKVLAVQGYEIFFTRFADSIISDHFRGAIKELVDVLNHFSIDESQIIERGGGKSSITQNLEELLVRRDWIKINITSEHSVSDRILSSESHEIDHYKSFERGNVGLEIEWNTKDNSFDRDLENFRKLHQIGELSLGIIITRGISLQDELINVFSRFLNDLNPLSIDDFKEFSLSDGAKKEISKFLELPNDAAIPKISKYMCTSKYSSTTTHMSKLLLRINRGLGNPCPLI